MAGKRRNLGFQFPKELFAMTMEDRIRSVIKWKNTGRDDGIDIYLLHDAKLISATDRRNEWELKIESRHCNGMGTLHGGAASAILDDLSAVVLFGAMKPGYLDAGYGTRSHDTLFLRPVFKGATIKIITEILDIGATTAHVRGEIRSMDDKICVVGSSDLFIRVTGPKL